MKKIAPAALNALKEALTHIYWYKADLRSFVGNCLDDTSVLSGLNWEGYKREIAASLVSHLARDEATYQSDLLRLMSEVARFDDFSHLARLEDGKRKVEGAQAAVAALKKQMSGHLELVEEQSRIQDRRERSRQMRLENRAMGRRLDELRSEYAEMITLPAPKRGYALEKLVNGLFSLFDLDPKASFRLRGEQIDGAFSFDGTDYLMETRWEKDPTTRKELDIFNAKIQRKLENTLGLFLSINGFSAGGVRTYEGQRNLMILMDGADLMAVLEGRIALDELLLLKRRRAAQRGVIYVPITDLFQEP